MEVTGPEKYVLYRDRPEWFDVVPVRQDDYERNVVKIAYSDEFVDAHDYFRAVLLKDERSDRTLNLTKDILLLNPANYTACEYLRNIIDHLKCDLQNELRFADKLTIKNPKNYQLWHHRQWLVKQMTKQASITATHDYEIRFIEMILEDDPKNYHAWQHRRWVINYFKLPSTRELEFTESMINVDVFNNSAWNHRFYVCTLDEVLSLPVLQTEIKFTQKHIRSAPNNESSFNYLYGLLVPLNNAALKESLPNGVNGCQLPSLTNLRSMRRFAEGLLADGIGNESSALHSFLVDVYADLLRLLLSKDHVHDRNPEQNSTESPSPNYENIPKTSNESVDEILRTALEYCDYLATEIDRIRVSYWRYRARQLELFVQNSSESSDQLS